MNCGADGSTVGGGGTIVGPAPPSITLTSPPPGRERPMPEPALGPALRPAIAPVPATTDVVRPPASVSPEHPPQTNSQTNAHRSLRCISADSTGRQPESRQ